MTKDILFLLGGDFEDNGEPWYCRHCAEVRGVLAYHPRLLDHIEVRYVERARPRAAMVELIGEAHQNAPTLVIGDAGRPVPAHILVREANGHRLVDNAATIGDYLAATYGVGRPHP